MIEILKQEDNVIIYKCGCGVKGMCMFKPPNKDGAMVVVLKCMSCGEAMSVTLLQCGDKSLSKSIESIDLLWVPFINEELPDEEEY